MKLSKALIRHMLSQAKDIDAADPERKLTVFTQTSYGDDSYLIYFFYVEGSPPKAVGWIEPYKGKGYSMRVRTCSTTSKLCWFDADGNKVRRSQVWGY